MKIKKSNEDWAAIELEMRRYVRFSDQLRTLTGRLEFTSEQMAEMMNVDVSTFCRYTNGSIVHPDYYPIITLRERGVPYSIVDLLIESTYNVERLLKECPSMRYGSN